MSKGILRRESGENGCIEMLNQIISKFKALLLSELFFFCIWQDALVKRL